MKYITTKSEDGKLELFTFPDAVPHNVMAEAVARMRNQTHGEWRRISRETISAGFIVGGKCCGESESLGLKSRPEDTELFLLA